MVLLDNHIYDVYHGISNECQITAMIQNALLIIKHGVNALQRNPSSSQDTCHHTYTHISALLVTSQGQIE